MNLEVLEENKYYHIYNRGINSATVFATGENKRYFLTLTEKYAKNVFSVMAYCLMDNHFHLVIKILDEKKVTQSLSNFFNAYVKAYNKQQHRTGSLFEKPFRRRHIESEIYLKNLILYIHQNPQNHGIVDDFKVYKFSSYSDYINDKKSLISDARTEVINLFHDIENFISVHQDKIDNDVSLDLSGFQNLKGLENSEDFSLKDQFYKYILNLQDQITSALEEVDGKATFQEDLWKRKEGGGGRTRVIEHGNIFEKGGVNISAVHGKLPEPLQKQFGVEQGDFFACGLSLVLHPKSPMIPTVHANWRYFEMYDSFGNIVTQWFGGGQDLTPYYLFEEDAVHFHTVCKEACDLHHPEFYPEFKKTCDEYFWNTHRNEARGVGGLFFDYLKETEEFSIQDRYNFVREVGNSFLKSYIPIVEKRRKLSYNQQHKDWQEIRRGRYVEFNLVHDRGTLFGLKTNGRIESILMSLPPTVQWKYNHHPEENSEEARLIEVLMHPKTWIL